MQRWRARRPVSRASAGWAKIQARRWAMASGSPGGTTQPQSSSTAGRSATAEATMGRAMAMASKILQGICDCASGSSRSGCTVTCPMPSSAGMRSLGWEPRQTRWGAKVGSARRAFTCSFSGPMITRRARGSPRRAKACRMSSIPLCGRTTPPNTTRFNPDRPWRARRASRSASGGGVKASGSTPIWMMRPPKRRCRKVVVLTTASQRGIIRSSRGMWISSPGCCQWRSQRPRVSLPVRRAARAPSHSSR